MTSQSAGAAAVDAVLARPAIHSVHDVYHQASRSFSHHPPIGARNSEPAVKRQKLENHSNAANIPTSGIKQEPCDGAPRNLAQNGAGLTTAPPQETTTDCPRAADEKCKTARTRGFPFLPARPCHGAKGHGTKQSDIREAERAPSRKEVQIKPYTPESPLSAPKYRKGGPADYYPWVGNHPEDTLNESTTRQGFYDKIHVSQNETSTARPSVWSSLKHKSGLQILSSLFVSALDQRQAYGTIAANCTFKPPPRVTLTDTKREAWLRDLADSSIPLRRLSRTIPHGIRGKSLLDQCLAKDIPIIRAVWLAKCVGANEIRAFKRKGASGAFAIGGEDKWIKDWTMNTEAFVESVIDECGSPGWRDRISYSLRIVTHLFSENLLDQEHYLNWVISSLQASSLDSIPVWLLVVKIYWKEILQHRQRGKRLAEALLEQMLKASKPINKKAYTPISEELDQCSQMIMRSAPACFLLPLSWSKYEALLRAHFGGNGEVSVSYFEQICERNLRLRSPSLNLKRSSIHRSENDLIGLLDRVSFNIDIGTFANQCLAAVPDQVQLITLCLDWATTLARAGHARIYFVVRLFRRWAESKIDLETPILGFLATKRNLPQLQKANIYKLLAELVHSKNLSVGRYLQWLMARGTITSVDRTESAYPLDLQWLFEIPLDGLPPPTQNLRRILISSLGSLPEKEADSIAATKARVVALIPEIFPTAVILESPRYQSSDFSRISQTVKSAVGRWIRQSVISFFLPRTQEAQDSNVPQGIGEQRTLAVVGPEQFRVIQNLLETFGEFSILADITKIISTSEDTGVLAAVADAVNCHFETFSAIGAVHDLFEVLHEQHEKLCRQNVVERPFLVSLTDLGYRLRRPGREIRKLRAEVMLYEQKHLAAACSPISDNMAESLQPAESSFVEGLEQVLFSGTVMEKNTMMKIFETITERITMSWRDDAVSERPPINFPELFMHLRAFDPSTFQSLVHGWIDNLLLSNSRPSFLKMMPPFICANVIGLKTIMERTSYLLGNANREINMASVALETLELTTMTSLDLPILASYKEYRYYVQKRHVIGECSELVIPVLHTVVEACQGAESQLRQMARDFVKSAKFRQILQGLLQQQSGNSDAISVYLGKALCVREVQVVIDGILYPSDRSTKESFTHGELVELLSKVNMLNAPLCKLKLRSILTTAAQHDRHFAEAIISIFKDKAESEDMAIIDVWASLMSGLSSDQASPIREAAENELFSCLPKAVGLSPGCSNGVLNSMIAVVGATAESICESAALSVIAQVAERITNLVSPTRRTSNNSCPGNLVCKDRGGSANDPYDYIDILLRLITIHHSAMQTSKYPENTLISLLLAFSLLLIHPCLISRPDLAEHVFDVLTLLTDSLPDDARTQCIRTLRDQHHSQDPRLLFIFGFSSSIDSEWLQLSTTSSWPPSSAARTEESHPPAITRQPFHLRRWEMMQDATPLVTENDTSLSLTLFGARKAVL